MAATLKGMAAVWGVGGLTFTGVVIDSTVGRLQTADFGRQADFTPLQNEVGDTVGGVFSDENLTIGITVIPTHATTVAGANANAATMLPAIGTQVVLVDANATTLPHEATNSAKHMVMSASFKRSNKGFGMIDMQLKQWTNSDLSSTSVTVA